MLEILNNSPKIMGILNMTPDSFYSKSCIGNKKLNSDFFNYCDIIDVGCESTRPYADKIELKIELNRLDDFLNTVNCGDSYLSIDTYKPEVAEFALQNGFSMINDIKAGGHDHSMFHIALKYNCPIVLMHMKGDPLNMQDNPCYDDIIDELLFFFEKKIKIADQLGLNMNNIILDPGIGFGKRIQDNNKIILHLNKIKKFNLPILIGLSRKSFLSIDGDDSNDRLATTIAASVLAIQNGADILRVHDVKETYKLIKILSNINNDK